MRLSLYLSLFAALFSGLLSQAQIRIGGPNLKSANVHVERGNLLKGKSTIAIAAYRVIFVTEDTTSARGTNNLAETAGGSASSNVSGRLMGLDKPLMQRLTDSLYADFLEKAKAAGYTVLDSQALASKSATYKALPMTENFETGRWGRYVIPTGQMSVEQANDDSKAVGRGTSKGLLGGFKQQAQINKKSDADKSMPTVSTEAGDVPVLAVTTVVSFAKFKSSGFTHWGQGARSSMELGPTINGIDEEGDPMATGIQFWTKDSSKNCIGCAKLPAAELRSDFHTNDHIGDMGKPVKHGDYDPYLTGTSSKELSASIGVDAADYEKNEYAQATKANDMLIQALAKER